MIFPQWSQHEVSSWYLDDEELSHLVKSVWYFPNKVSTRSSVDVLMIWFPFTLFEISIAIPSRSVDCENIYFPHWSLSAIPRWNLEKDVISLYVYYFVAMICYFQIMFLPSEVKPRNRILFPQLVLIFLMECSSWMWFSRVLIVPELVLPGYPKCYMSVLSAYTW